MHNYEKFLNGRADFRCEGETVEKFPLVVDAIGIPFLINKEGTGSNIKGEIFEVSDEMLVALDGLEQHPHWYERRKRQIKTSSGIEEIWVYMIPKGPNTDTTPLFNEYTMEQHKKYVSGDSREGLLKADWGGYEKQ